MGDFGDVTITPQMASLLTMQTSLQSAAAFVVSYEQMRSLRHALIAKFPQLEAKISLLMGNMFRSAYTTTVQSVKDKLKQSYFDFNA